jgi:2-methylaconitate cis-trans-isomerase PrpF
MPTRPSRGKDPHQHPEPRRRKDGLFPSSGGARAPSGREDVFEITLADIVNPIVSSRLDAFGLDGTETKWAISSRGDSWRAQQHQGSGAVSLGGRNLPGGPETTSAVPKIALVAPLGLCDRLASAFERG